MLGSKDRFNPERLIIAFGVINTIWEVKQRRRERCLSHWRLTSLHASGLHHTGCAPATPACYRQNSAQDAHKLGKNSPQDVQERHYPTPQCCYWQLNYFSGVLRRNTNSLALHEGVLWSRFYYLCQKQQVTMPRPAAALTGHRTPSTLPLNLSHAFIHLCSSLCPALGDRGTSNSEQGKAGSNLT